MPEMMAFKAGKYAQGDWPKERVQKTADAYDPEKSREAPLVIRHRRYGTDDGYQSARGWVKSLRMDGGGKVYADIPEFPSKVKQALAEKRLRSVPAGVGKQGAAAAPYLKAR